MHETRDDSPHAVARLRAACMAHSGTLPRLDRGAARKSRCARCRLIPSHCMCALRPLARARAGLCLIMAEFEPLKPSNTGWLIADVLPDTAAFSWSRMEVDPALPALLADPQWQPYVVFPGEFAAPERVRTELLDQADDEQSGKRPLFILLDGTWSEARKIFRKSPYLNALPVLSLQPEQLSRYRLRRSTHDHHFCTSEVAALCLALAGDLHAAQTLEAYLDVFSARYLSARQSVPADGEDEAHRRLRALHHSAPPASRP
ncbi:MAG TPA: DTW domain-containing protein [Ideonella sp.]|uniref:tRNA-uridine aminocarboxypropyltransferase n=1 Tax=Ideonella sp. TaxID=1929293 RepID=UPI002CF43A80|nr:DTW domain-containing protein [Ideonella sp.]HSI47388.1 DTW domain-containing protein [Ideonella sp.]